MNLSVEPVTALCKSTGVCALPSSPMYSQPSLAADEVDLDRGELPLAPEHVFGQKVGLRTVEGRLCLFVVGDGGRVERLTQPSRPATTWSSATYLATSWSRKES